MVTKGTLLILVVLCAYTCAMVPRQRIARNTLRPICDPRTPCSWGIYRKVDKEKIIETVVENDYCSCPKGMECTDVDDVYTISTYIYRCQDPSATPPPPTPTTTTTESLADLSVADDAAT